MTSSFFEKFRFHRPDVNMKTAFSKTSTLESVFGHRFHRIRVDGRSIRKEKFTFSKENGYLWTGPYARIRAVPPSALRNSRVRRTRERTQTSAAVWKRGARAGHFSSCLPSSSLEKNWPAIT